MSLIEEQRENLTALSEPVEVEVSLKDYEQLDNLPKLNGETIIGDMTVNETVEIRDGNDRSIYTITELRTLTNNSKALTYNGIPIIAYAFTGTGDDRKFLFTYCEAGSNGSQMWFWRKYVDVDKYIITVGRTNLPLGINGKTWASPPDTEITLYAGDIQAEANWSPSDDKDLATKKYVDDNKQVQSDWDEADNTKVDYIKNKPNLSAVATSGDYDDLLNKPTIPDISGCEVTSNKVTSLSNASTDTQYPSAKCVYDLIGDVEQILADLIGGA